MGGSYSVPKDKPTKVYDETVAKLPSMSGKVVAITGCTSGTGFIAAKTVAAKGGEVIMLNRQSERAEKALKDIQELVPAAKLLLIPCDLSDFGSVREAAKQVRAKYPQGLDVLCNNAGIMACADKACNAGFDVQMKTNHLSHFLLTKELMPLLDKRAKSVGEARVVNHSSGARAFPNTPLSAAHLGKNGGNLGGDSAGWLLNGPRWERYHQTKLANVVFTLALHERLAAAGSKVKTMVAEPGLAATNLQATTASEGGMNAWFTSALMSFSQSAEDGACGILRCICDPAAKSGEMFCPTGSLTGPAEPKAPEAICTNPESLKLLWKLSNEAIGEDFVV